MARTTNRMPDLSTKLPWHTDRRTEIPSHQFIAIRGRVTPLDLDPRMEMVLGQKRELIEEAIFIAARCHGGRPLYAA